MLFSGTMVVAGAGRGVVTATGAATEIGVPLCMALTMLFTSLVMRNGVLMSILLGVVVYVFAHVVVKFFFSHH